MSVCLVCISHMAGVHHTILHTAVYISSSCLIEKPWIIAPHLQHSWILILRMPPVHMALWPVQHMSTAKVRSSRRGNACVVPSQHTITILTYQLHIPYDNTTSLTSWLTAEVIYIQLPLSIGAVDCLQMAEIWKSTNCNSHICINAYSAMTTARTKNTQRHLGETTASRARERDIRIEQNNIYKYIRNICVCNNDHL